MTGIDEYALIDIDDTIKEVHDHQKQGARFGCLRGARPERSHWDRLHSHRGPDHPRHRPTAPISGCVRSAAAAAAC